MKENNDILEPLLERAEKYGKIKIELIRLKALDKSASVFSELASQSVFFVAGILFISIFSVAIALYLGTLFGANYLGFFCVSGFYAFCLIMFYFLLPAFKNRVKNSLIQFFFTNGNEE